MTATATALPVAGLERPLVVPHLVRNSRPRQKQTVSVTNLAAHRLLRTRVLGGVINECRYAA
ncbi:hypothetical protein [Streptomyces bluensis]|uniref:Transposase n=1 Tax=Streptomyces bluensis TaxID=33897 RepID=A0ABW6USZ4_9ACTN